MTLPGGTLVPEWSLHPGAVLREMLDRRNMRQSELAERTGLSAKHINQLIKGNIGVSGDVAVVLERALDVPARFWTGLDADYQAWSSTQKARATLPEFADWVNGFDRQTLLREQVITLDDDTTSRVDKVLRFFRVATPLAFERTWLDPASSGVAFRRSQSFSIAERNTALWIRLVEKRAERLTPGPFDTRALRRVARSMPRLAQLGIRDGFVAAQAALCEAGVALCFVRQVPGTRVCGATLWPDRDRPVIGLTERQRKPDVFWFTLAHEIGHLLLHPKRTAFLDLENSRASEPADAADSMALEREADSFAETLLLPPGATEQIARATTSQQLVVLSAKLQLPVSVVAGQHGHLTTRWHVGAKLRGRITDNDVAALENL